MNQNQLRIPNKPFLALRFRFIVSIWDQICFENFQFCRQKPPKPSSLCRCAGLYINSNPQKPHPILSLSRGRCSARDPYWASSKGPLRISMAARRSSREALCQAVFLPRSSFRRSEERIPRRRSSGGRSSWVEIRHWPPMVTVNLDQLIALCTSSPGKIDHESLIWGMAFLSCLGFRFFLSESIFSNQC